MEIYDCEDAVQRALTRPRPKHIVKIINEVMMYAGYHETQHLAQQDGTQSQSSSADAKSSAKAKKPTIDFVCIDCRDDGPEGRARAFFSAPPPTVVFCANRLHSANEVEETMVHELIHAYDFTVRKMDITKADVLACSEIRSARESECYHKAQILAKLMPDVDFFQNTLSWLHKRCVREHAVRSTRSMFPDEARDQVDKMFDRCYADHSPFPQQ